MQLRDIIKEDASEEAKRKGLEYYGFGRYGTDGKITHISQNGSLVPYIPPEKQSGTTKVDTQPQSPEQPTSTQSPTVSTSTSGDSSVSSERPRSYVASSISSVSEKIQNTIGSDGKLTSIDDTLSAITSVYGRDTAPLVQRGGEGLRMAEEHFGFAADAVYNYHTDTIELSDSVEDFSEDPVDDWAYRQIDAFKTYVHETLHSTSPRISADNQFYNSGLGVALEEGMTEYLAQGIVQQSIGHLNPDVGRVVNDRNTYGNYVDAIELLATRGKLDVDSAFRNPDGDTVKGMVWDAQWRLVESTFGRAKISDMELYNSMMTRLRSDWQNDSMTFLDSEISDLFLYMHEELDAGKDVSSLVDQLKRTFK